MPTQDEIQRAWAFFGLVGPGKPGDPHAGIERARRLRANLPAVAEMGLLDEATRMEQLGLLTPEGGRGARAAVLEAVSGPRSSIEPAAFSLADIAPRTRSRSRATLEEDLGALGMDPLATQNAVERALEGEISQGDIFILPDVEIPPEEPMNLSLLRRLLRFLTTPRGGQEPGREFEGFMSEGTPITPLSLEESLRLGRER